MNIGKIILDLRKKKNITQDELAAELGVTSTAVSKWENGYTLPDILMLCALADYFAVTTDDLLGRNPKPIYAAIATTSLQLGNQIQTLLKQYGIYAKQIIYGGYEDAMEIINADPSITHLFISFDKPMDKYERGDTNVHIIESHADTVKKIIEGFEIYLNNMTEFEALAPKNKGNT